jgi:hypothetical protein
MGGTVSRHYGRIAFTDPVNEIQERYGSRPFYARHQARANGSDERDAMTVDVADFLLQRDGFYLASVSETGWPYVQFRGGRPGFVRVLDTHTFGWADFRGNLQYISTGNITADDRVALFFMDYPGRRRLKVFGHARVVFSPDDPALLKRLTVADDDSVVERAVLVTVEAFDWNCPQHITPRYSTAELEPRLGALHAEIAALRAENEEIRKSCMPDE